MADILKEYPFLNWKSSFLKKGRLVQSEATMDSYYVSGLAESVEKAISYDFQKHNVISLCASTQSTKSTMLRHAAALKIAQGKRVFFLNAVPHLDLKKQNLKDVEVTGAYWLDKYAMKAYLNGGIQAIDKSPYLNDIIAFVECMKKEPRNVYVFGDEAAFGTQWDSIYSKVILMVLEAKAHLLLCTATPFDQLSSDAWKDRVRILHLSHKLLKRAGYWGVTDFLSAKRVTDIGLEVAISDNKPTPRMREAVKEFLAQKKYGFFLIRMEKDTQIEAFSNWLQGEHGVPEGDIHRHDATKKFDFKRMHTLQGHHFILFKDLMRVGYRLPHKSRVWGVWEQATSMDTLVQGLIGRVTGMNEDNQHIRIFSCLNTLECFSRYERGLQISKPTNKKIGIRVEMSKKKKRIKTASVENITNKFPEPGRWTPGMRLQLRRQIREYFKKFEPNMSCVISFTSGDKWVYEGVLRGRMLRHKMGVRGESESGHGFVKHSRLGWIYKQASITVQDQHYGKQEKSPRRMPFKITLAYWREASEDERTQSPTCSHKSIFEESRLPMLA